MCIATPMQVLTTRAGLAQCVDRHGQHADVDLALVGAVDAGAWLLVFQGAAREIVDAARAADIDRALTALDALQRGDPSLIDGAFADLIGREPQLPDFLRNAQHPGE